MIYNKIIYRIVFALSLLAQILCTEASYHHWWYKYYAKSFLTANDNTFMERDASTPLTLVFLPEYYENERCLDGSKFGYYIRRSKSIVNSNKWIFLLEGGGLCVEPIDCIMRKNTDEGSSLYWSNTFIPGTDGMKDILLDDIDANPSFYDYNHVYLKYCSGDTWTGARTSFDRFGLWFSGHSNIRAVVHHLNETENLQNATHILLTGLSAGGIGVHNNADYFRDKWISHSTIFRAASVAGFYFPGPVVAYPEYALNVTVPLNNLATKYMTSWFGSVLDESCLMNTPERYQHRCWDSHYLYKHIDTRLFVIENRFDESQIHDVLLCPFDHIENNSTDGFIKWFGNTMSEGLKNTVQSDLGIKKGDGLFVPSCLDHTLNFCIQGGPKVGDKKIGDLLPKWFLENDPVIASTYQEVDTCNINERTEMPCNIHCHC